MHSKMNEFKYSPGPFNNRDDQFIKILDTFSVKKEVVTVTIIDDSDKEEYEPPLVKNEERCQDTPLISHLHSNPVELIHQNEGNLSENVKVSNASSESQDWLPADSCFKQSDDLTLIDRKQERPELDISEPYQPNYSENLNMIRSFALKEEVHEGNQEISHIEHFNYPKNQHNTNEHEDIESIKPSLTENEENNPISYMDHKFYHHNVLANCELKLNNVHKVQNENCHRNQEKTDFNFEPEETNLFQSEEWGTNIHPCAINDKDSGSIHDVSAELSNSSKLIETKQWKQIIPSYLTDEDNFSKSQTAAYYKSENLELHQPYPYVQSKESAEFCIPPFGKNERNPINQDVTESWEPSRKRFHFTKSQKNEPLDLQTKGAYCVHCHQYYRDSSSHKSECFSNWTLPSYKPQIRETPISIKELLSPAVDVSPYQPQLSQRLFSSMPPARVTKEFLAYNDNCYSPAFPLPSYQSAISRNYFTHHETFSEQPYPSYSSCRVSRFVTSTESTYNIPEHRLPSFRNLNAHKQTPPPYESNNCESHFSNVAEPQGNGESEAQPDYFQEFDKKPVGKNESQISAYDESGNTDTNTARTGSSPQATDKKSGSVLNPCIFCPKLFVTRALLNAHTLYKCANKKIVCNKCLVRFTTNTHLMRHQGSKQCIPKSFECKGCENRYKSVSSLKKHQKLYCVTLANSSHKEQDEENEVVIP